MIFKPELVKKIQAGTKTMTRRPVRPGEKSCTYEEGHSYAVTPGRGKLAVLRITVTEVRREHVGQINLRDARKEGFRTTGEFFDYWHRLYGPPATAGLRALEHARAELENEGLVDTNIEVSALIASIDESRKLRIERLPLPAMPSLVWVISFAKGDLTDTPRFLRETAPMAASCTAILKSGPRRGKVCGRAFPDYDYMSGREVMICQCGARRPPSTLDDRGYTGRRSAAMKGEGEAVPADVQERLTKRAADNAANGYIREREKLMAAVAEIRSYAVDPDALKTLKGVERQLATLDRKIRRV